MRFQKIGKTYQLRLDEPADLEAVLSLDDSLWVATSAPVGAFRCDPAFTAMLDGDGNGRINSDEVRAAIRWLLARLADRDGLKLQTDELKLSAIRGDCDEGRALASSASYVLESQGKPEADTISLAATRPFLADMEKHPLNGDGIIVPEAAPDPETMQFIKDVVECTGGTADVGGKTGASQANVDAFLKAVSEYLVWKTRGEAAAEGNPSEVLPFGSATPAIYSAYRQHAGEVDAFFALCRAHRFDPALVARVGCPDSKGEAADLTRIEELNACLALEPMAEPVAECELPLLGGAVNPLYSDWLMAFRDQVLEPVLGELMDMLSERDWHRVKKALAPYAVYIENRKGACVASLPDDRLCLYRDGDFDDKAGRLMAADKEVGRILGAARDLERLLLCHKSLFRLAQNFVNFAQLYAIEERALFEMGSAVVDGRWFNLALNVTDLNAHAAIAKTSNIFTLYLEITGKADEKPFHVAVPATAGSKGNLVVGKRGVFFDTAGREYGAKVVRIIANPISVREALVAPFVRLWAFIVGKIEAISTSSEKGLQKATGSLMKKTPSASAAPGGPAGMFVGLSLSVAAIGSAFAFIAKTVAELTPTQRALGLLGAVSVVAVPVLLTAMIKLRKRDLSSLLEGCGWAINTRMRLTRAQRRRFTRREPLPSGVVTTARWRWLWAILVIVLALILFAMLRDDAGEGAEAEPAPSEETNSAPANAAP